MLLIWAYLIATLWLGIASRKGFMMNKLEDWGVAGRSMNTTYMYFLAGAAGISAYTFMGSPGWAYSKGAPVWYVITYLAIMQLMSYYWAPRAWQMSKDFGLHTLCQAIGDRYDSKFVRALSSLVSSIQGFAYSVLQATGSAYILSVMSGGAISHEVGVMLVLVIIAIYIYTSGLRAMGVTNVMQGILMLAVSIISGLYLSKLLFNGFSFTKGFTELLAASPQHFTLPGLQKDWPWQFWTTSILISFFTISNGGWIGAAAGRSADIVRKSRVWLSTYYIILLPTIFIGFMGVMYLPGVKPVDQIAVRMGMQYFPALLVGLYGAGTLAAAMSSAEPGFHTTAFSYARDVVQPYAKSMDDTKVTKLARGLVWLCMLVTAAIAMRPGTTLVYMLLWGYAFGSQLFPLVFGILWWPRATKQGAAAGLVVGFIVALYCTNVWKHPYGIHGGFVGLAFNMAAFVIVSLLTKPSPRSTIEKYFPDIAADVLEDSDK